jgi:hypothetical protein
MLRFWGILSVVAGYIAIITYVSTKKDKADFHQDKQLEDSEGQTDPDGMEESTTSWHKKTLISGVAGSTKGIDAPDEEVIRAACAAVEEKCHLLQTEVAKRRLRQRVREVFQKDKESEVVRRSLKPRLTKHLIGLGRSNPGLRYHHISAYERTLSSRPDYPNIIYRAE